MAPRHGALAPLPGLPSPGEVFKGRRSRGSQQGQALQGPGSPGNSWSFTYIWIPQIMQILDQDFGTTPMTMETPTWKMGFWRGNSYIYIYIYIYIHIYIYSSHRKMIVVFWEMLGTMEYEWDLLWFTDWLIKHGNRKFYLVRWFSIAISMFGGDSPPWMTPEG